MQSLICLWDMRKSHDGNKLYDTELTFTFYILNSIVNMLNYSNSRQQACAKCVQSVVYGSRIVCGSCRKLLHD